MPLFVPPDLPANLDVYPFRGAGRYASDSFRIYSHLLPGKGAPDGEAKWLAKRERAIARAKAHPHRNGRSQMKKTSTKVDIDENPVDENAKVDEEVWGVEELGEYLSDDEPEGQEEWRNVKPTDKELRRYLVRRHASFRPMWR